MAFWRNIFSLSLLVLSASFLDCSAITSGPSAYQVLRQYNFPAGLLPEGAANCSLNSATGEFSAHLNFNGSGCRFKLENSYELKYQPVIKGLISRGSLRKLSGVSVKVVLMWLAIVEVSRKGDDLEFSVGLASADFPARNFDRSPHCGSGLDFLV